MKGFTVAGHIAMDQVITEEGIFHQLGGPPCYAASLGKTLGFPVKIVTRIGEDFPDEYMPTLDALGIYINKTPNTETTKFILDYRFNPRRIQLPSICEPIGIKEISKAESLVFCPIADEVNDQLMMEASHSILALDPQGLIREVGKNRLVFPKNWMNTVLFEKLDILKTSSSEHMQITGIYDIEKSLRKLRGYGVKNAVITAGEGGSYVLNESGYYHVPTYPVNVVDSTGAGDVYMAGLCAFINEGAEWACSVAAASSSTIVETRGVEIKLERDEIIERAEKVYEGISRLD